MGRFRKAGLTVAALLVLSSPGAGCAASRDFNSELGAIVAPYRFDVLGWETRVFYTGIKGWISGAERNEDRPPDRVVEYFNSMDRLKTIRPAVEAVINGDRDGDLAALETELATVQTETRSSAGAVESIIQAQIKRTLAEQGIFNPLYRFLGLKIGFPPVNFKLEEPLYLLVVSPRSNIERLSEVILKQDITLDDIAKIEDEVDALGVSSLVVQLGGFAGTYPTFVTNRADIRFTINAAIEEWAHQYLALKPLGFRYVLHLLGVVRSDDIATMNETLAGMVSRELGAMVYEQFYQELNETPAAAPRPAGGFDFNQAMRGIRTQVDAMLARGEINAAESYMEQQRKSLASKGYHIRKLNQAYFAFYGVYTDSPGSVNPVGEEMARLRKQSSSLSDFLEKASVMTGRADLVASLKQ